MPPIVTLTTDFGLSDHYAGTMKGVILSLCPKAQLVDISHLVQPYAISAGAYTIAQAYRYFPAGTVHVVVVDPGVGSERRPILAEAAGQYFIAPDNGVLSMVLAREKHKVRVIANSRYMLSSVSRTFHGRDVFAPVAGHLAAGVSSAKFGKRVNDWVRPEFLEPSEGDPGVWDGHVLAVDHFGNVITNFEAVKFPKFTHVEIAQAKVKRTAETYAEAPEDRLFAIVGSAGYWELSMQQASAATKLRCASGDACRLIV